MAIFKCEDCGKEVNFELGMTHCPVCNSVIGKELLTILSDSEDRHASIDTPRGTATVKGTAIYDEQEEPEGGSSKTALAADLGYADIPEHYQTMQTPEEAYESAGRSSSMIPLRSVSDAETNGEIRDYKIESKIGEGTFGVVYRAVQVPLDRSVAIKLLKPLPLPESTESDKSRHAREMQELRFREEFLREAQFNGKLEHPNIVPIHDIGIVTGGERSDRPFYVMKEIKGISWQEVIREKNRDENMEIFNRVVDAIGFAHSNNILHVDLKPENVMLGEYGEVLVVDWGQALDTSKPETIRPGGSPAFVSPEMAKFWCDVYLTRTKPTTRNQIGPRSDVYTLGAILFQIVTGHPPHYGLKGETSEQVMVRASRNEIRRHEPYVNDELMQIALRALRKTDEEIGTVAQLRKALDVYEERRRSIETRDRAYELLESARVTSDYDTYQKAKFGFEESLQLWSDNNSAREGLQQTRLSCAELALDDQNFDLGLGMLDTTDTDEEKRVKVQLQKGKTTRDRRKRLVGILGLAFAASLIAGSLLVGYQANNVRLARTELKHEQNQRVTELQKFNTERQSMDQERLTFAGERQSMQQERTRFDSEREAMTTERAGMDIERTKFKNERTAMQTERSGWNTERQGFFDEKERLAGEIADEKKKVKLAQESNKLLAYKNGINSIAQSLSKGDFKEASNLLNQSNTKDSFEWRRLNLLSHPEVTSKSLFPNEELMGAKVSGDRKRIALCYLDRIEIRDAGDLQKPGQVIKQDNVAMMSLSHDGSRLAVGSTSGKIDILDVNSGRSVLNGTLLDAQNQITDINFSKDGQRLLAIGAPNLISRGNGEEHELMVWDLAPSPTLLNMTRYRNSERIPKLTSAVFSNDGNWIVTSNPGSNSENDRVYVFQYDSERNAFDLKHSPKTERGVRFVASIFADDSGNQVVSSIVNQEGDATRYEIVVWDVDDTEPISTRRSEQSKSPSEKYEPILSISVDERINSLDFSDSVLLGSGDQRNLYYWNLGQTIDASSLEDAELRVFRGHGKPVDSAAIVKDGDGILSISKGNNPEVVLTDLDDFVDEFSNLALYSDSLTITGSAPMAFHESSQSDQSIVASDHGLVSIKDANGKTVLSWEVSAWKRHVVTAKHLFALSKRDDLFRYNLATGELETIITQLSQVDPQQKMRESETKQITSLEISHDSSHAVLQRNNGKKEVEVWNLNAFDVQVIDYGNLDGVKDLKSLSQLTISDDGSYIAGGKVRFYVWRNDGTEVGFAGIEGNSKTVLSSLEFFKGSPKLAAGYENIVKVYDPRDLGTPGDYRVENLAPSFDRPNIIDARTIAGIDHAIVRNKNFEGLQIEANQRPGISLVKLQNGKATIVKSLPGFESGAISSDGKIVAIAYREQNNLFANDKEETISIPARNSGRSIGRSDGPRGNRTVFDRVFVTDAGQVVLNWESGGYNNTISVAEDGALSELSVIAAPVVESVRLTANQALTFENGKVRIWQLDLTKDQPAVKILRSLPGVYDRFFPSPDAKTALAVANDGGRAGLLDVSSGQFDAIAAIPANSKLSVAAWSHDRARIAMGYEDGSIIQFDVTSGGTKSVQNANNAGAVSKLCYSKDGNSIVAVQGNSAYANRAVEPNPNLDVEQPQLEQSDGWITVKLAHSDNDAIVAADISPDGKRVVTGSRGGRVTIWSAESEVDSLDDESGERELYELYDHDAQVRFVQFGKSGDSVVSFSDDEQNNRAVVIPTSR